MIGSDSLVYEAELTQIYDQAFTALGVPVTIKLNNRKILFGIAEAAGIADRFMDMTVAIDKLDKIGIEGVRKELADRGVPEKAIASIEKTLSVPDLEGLRAIFAGSPTGLAGLDELGQVFRLLSRVTLKNEVVFDITLARGLSYYTGCIYEVAAKGVKIGSIGGGGRYADLTGVFGVPGLSGVGVSFGADRIYDVMEELKLFPESLSESVKVLFVSFDQPSFEYAFQCASALREAGISCDIYPEPGRLKKQFESAAKRKVPYVAIIGETEVGSGTINLKNQANAEQHSLTIGECIRMLA